MTAALDRERALRWLESWDRQQEYYMPDREERFAVIGDVLDERCGRPDPLIVDLGVGPGSLAKRLLDRFPGAEVVGVDADPLLVGLAEAAYGDDERLRTVLADLRTPGWVDSLKLPRAPDAFVSTTSLHWMNREPLRSLLSECGRTLERGGLFVNGDHLYEGSEGPALDDLTRALTSRRAARAGLHRTEDWQAWWRAVEQAPELADLREAARQRRFRHVVTERPSVHDYLMFLREAGFAEAGLVWQVGDDRIAVGIK